jgi:hypothetical protein
LDIIKGRTKLRKFIGVAASLMLWPFPELAGLLVFIWLFWENLGDLTLRIYEDYQMAKTEEALEENIHADVDGLYVHMLTLRSVAERERRNRANLAWKRRLRAIYRAIAPASIWGRHLIQRWQMVPMRPAIEEE